MRDTIPNVQLTAFREAQNWTRAEMADRLNQTPTGIEKSLACDEERIRRWERGEVLWPHPPYRRALHELSGRSAGDLGFVPPSRQKNRHPLVGAVIPQNALAAESDLFDTMELARMADASDVGPGTIETVQEAVELLCRAYPSTPAAVLKERVRQRLKYVIGLLNGRITLEQHRGILVQAGWLAALLGCVHYDLGEREPAEAARQAAFQMGKQAGHGELMGWAYEMSAWFALTEGRYEDVVDATQRGQAVAGTTSAMVQLTLQEAKGQARLGNQSDSREALERGAVMLGRLPAPTRPDHHFVFDHTKWIFYAATIYAWLGDDERAEEHAQEVIRYHTRSNGTTNAPMRMASARIDLAIVNARRGELDTAVDLGLSAFDFQRKSLGDLVSRGEDLDQILRTKYRREKLAGEFHEQLVTARRAVDEQRPELLE
jgi:transcriptional regulator with XRE-family HTH domain